MQRRQLGLAVATAASITIATGARVSAQSAPVDDPVLLRVFLSDGRSLVSYGEPARVDGRVVFSMPSSASANAPLQLLYIAVDRDDWVRSNRYAASFPTSLYIENHEGIAYMLLLTAYVNVLYQDAVSR